MATPTLTPYFGMRASDDFATDMRPLNWRDGILFLWPNGMAPLTAMGARMKSMKTDDPQFHWWEKTLATQAGAITNTWRDAALSSAYTSDTAVAGTVIYFQCAAALIPQFRAGLVVMLIDESNNTNNLQGIVTATDTNGASSYIAVRTLILDGSGDGGLSDTDRILVIGNANEEGALIPDSIAYDPTKHFNYTQIFRTPLDITRTAQATHLRTGDPLKEARREALQLHSIEQEKAKFWGARSENVGANGKPLRTFRGLFENIETNAADNVVTYTTDTDYSGQAWTTGGMDWLNAKLEVVFRYGRSSKMAWCGSGALLGIQRLAEANGHINIAPRQKVFGIEVNEWVTPFGTIMLKTHPLFSYEQTYRNTMVVHEPEEMTERVITQTKLKKDPSVNEAGYTAYDGIKEEYLTEVGVEWHHALTGGIFYGLNTANTV